LDYARFARLRGPIWESFARDLAEAKARPKALDYEALENLAFHYRQVLHDHALAVTRYPGTAAAKRLARLALAGTNGLVRAPTPPNRGLRHFFVRRFPEAFRAQAKHLIAVVALFAVGAAFGFRLGAVQPGAGISILGPESIEGLEQGRLWTESLVSVIPPSVSASTIARNNMSVALMGWAGGALAGLGSVYVVALNGVLLGAVFGVTSRYAMAGLLLEFVVAHGPLEIGLILVTAAAGLRLGQTLVVASDGPRREGVTSAAVQALAVLGGCLPWFVLLGIVEATVSPAPTLPFVVKATLGVSLLGAFLALAWGRPEV
jgi:uncharacterized membrane protein SpoIIM required for sporulation